MTLIIKHLKINSNIQKHLSTPKKYKDIISKIIVNLNTKSMKAGRSYRRTLSTQLDKESNLKWLHTV